MILCNADKLSRRFNLFKKAVKEGLNDFMQGTDKSESNNINKLRFFKIKFCNNSHFYWDHHQVSAPVNRLI